MTPTPQEVRQNEISDASGLPGHSIVISGMSGVYPNARSVKELADMLYNKKNPIKKEVRWNFKHPESHEYSGNIPDIDLFDAQFFKVHYQLAMNLDVMARKLLELAYQAIYDAGICPEELNGMKVGVYVGSGLSESEKATFYGSRTATGFGLLGNGKTMQANRISYALNLKGPSLTIDGSSEIALEAACQDIANGECEAAIVGGASVTLHPQTMIHYGRATLMCMDGKTKSFDKNANGSIRTEAVNVIFLQKAKDAKRVYAKIVGVKHEYCNLTTNENIHQTGFYRDPINTTAFLRQFYEDIGVPPQAIEYVEACGSADPEADKAELESIAETFCNNRNNSLFVGSVTSNIGYTESAHGISAITKVLLGYNTGVIAANIHCQNLRDDVEAINKGKLRIVTEHEPLKISFAAINNLTLTGINGHILLQSNYKPKNFSDYKCDLPRLVNISARQDSFVKNIIEDLKSRPVDPEEISLLHNIHGRQIYGHLGRGYCILDSSSDGSAVCLSETVTYFDESKRPLWFVYSGMGSQWAGMGTQLMRIPMFAAAIERCHKALEPKGINLTHIITSPDKDMFKNILHSFIGIAAIQIGLTDVLKSVEIVPDMIIGHSTGELACAYADGCLTTEETILLAYYRGIVSIETPTIRGAMAAIGMGFEEISKIVPAEIEVACHNGPDSSTITGPADKVQEFVSELTAKGAFAKEVPCSNIAYHSRYIAKMGPSHLKCVNEVIKNPKLRSEHWLSTSVPKSRWNESIAKYSSAEYYTNNLLNPVLFEETARLIPPNAVVVEVAPHGLLQAILKRSLPSTCKNIALTKRGHKDNAFFLLDAIGKLYVEGFNPKIEELYPKVKFPVSNGTPMLSHLIEWVHTEKWSVPLYSSRNRGQASACTFYISLYDDEYKNLKGNIIQDKMLYPFAAALIAAWDTLSMSLNRPRRRISVVFRDLQFYTQPVLLHQKPLKIHIMFTRGNGRFQVMNNNSKLVTGCLIASEAKVSVFAEQRENETLNISSNDIYQYFAEKGFYYQNDFQSLFRVNPSLTEAKIIWNDDWVTFLDGILQFMTLRHDYNHISQPCRIRKMFIDVNTQISNHEILEDKTVRTANVSSISSAVKCGGVVIKDIKFRNLNVNTEKTITLKKINLPEISNKAKTNANITNTKGIKLKINNIGDLNSLTWVPTFKKPEAGVEVNVKYAAISDLDVKKATGTVTFSNDNNSFGMDFSGVTKSGKRVMGLLWCGSLTDRVIGLPETLWPVPEHWSLEDAATVPSAYMLALYCLVVKAELLAGMKILVHGGAGALGQAVISIALAHKCEVFSTVSDISKKCFLLKLFPELEDDHIWNSRNNTFADIIKVMTKDKDGIKLIIGCVKGEIKNLSLSIGDTSCIFLDLVQKPTNEIFDYGLYHMFKCRTYKIIDFHSIFDDGKIEELKKLQQILGTGIVAGWVRPLSRVTYGPDEVPRAFRLLAASQHRGRVLIKLGDANIPTQPRFVCDPEKVQIVICSRDQISSQWIDYLISRDAKNVMMHYPSLPSYLPLKIRSWQKHGVKVNVSSENLNTIEGVIKFINESQKIGNIEGIYVMATKVELDVKIMNNIIENLDNATRKLKLFMLLYFGILTTTEEIGRDVCLSRIQNDLTASLLDASGRNNESLHEVLVAFDNALLSPRSLYVIDSKEVSKKTLLQSLAYVSELNIPKNTEDKTSLKDLGIKSERLPVVVSFFMDQYHISLSEEEIVNLTVERIKEIEHSFREPQFEKKRGLAIFFSSIPSDELLATADSVYMPTLTNSATGLDQHFDDTESYMCIIPGLEGHYGRFQELCQLLKLPAVVLQPGLDQLQESLDERAQRLTKILLKKTKLVNNKFYLLGFETGIIVALKMASILEMQGLTGTVFSLGGTPEEIFAKIKAETSVNAKDLQNEVALHMFLLITGKDIDLREVEEVIEGESWLNPWMHALRGHVSHSLQYTRALIEGAYEAINSTKAYVLDEKPLRSRLVLIRASDVDLESPPESLLQRYSQQPVKVVTIPTPLAHLTKDLRCAAVVNKNLEPQTLQAYSHRNLCDSYIFTTDIFVYNAENNY